jgi:hypothetical protein
MTRRRTMDKALSEFLTDIFNGRRNFMDLKADAQQLMLIILEHEAERSRVILKIEAFCDKCEYRSDPGSCEDCELHSITGRSTGDSKIDQSSP